VDLSDAKNIEYNNNTKHDIHNTSNQMQSPPVIIIERKVCVFISENVTNR